MALSVDLIESAISRAEKFEIEMHKDGIIKLYDFSTIIAGFHKDDLARIIVEGYDDQCSFRTIVLVTKDDFEENITIMFDRKIFTYMFQFFCSLINGKTKYEHGVLWALVDEREINENFNFNASLAIRL